MKHKRSKLEWDENSQEWRRRYGYKKAGDAADTPIIEAGPDDQASGGSGSFPFRERTCGGLARAAESCPC